MTRPLTVWPAALRLDQAADYCGLSVDVFKAVCPVKPIEFTQSTRGSLPTATPGEVWSGEEAGRQRHPHHHLVRGTGAWWGCRKFVPSGGEISEAVGKPCLKVLVRYRRVRP